MKDHSLKHIAFISQSLTNKKTNWIKDIKKWFCAFLMLPSLAYAQSSESPVGQGLSYVVNSIVYGTDGVVIATIAVAGVGLACLKHVMEWKYFFYTIGGIAIIFGAPAIVQGIKSLVTV